MIKKICISLLIPGCMLYAKEVCLTLPGSTNRVSYTGSKSPTFENYKDKEQGTLWLSSNNGGGLNNYPQNGEGTWVNSDNVGTITMCGRAAAYGDHFAMILGSDITVGSQVASLTLSAGDIGNISATGVTINSYSLMIAIYDGSTQIGAATGTAGTKLITLNPTGDATSFVWGENYKIIAIVKGGSNSGESDKNTTSYTISDIQVKADVTVPEPTTATLSLLALAGMCGRRRRQKA